MEFLDQCEIPVSDIPGAPDVPAWIDAGITPSDLDDIVRDDEHHVDYAVEDASAVMAEHGADVMAYLIGCGTRIAAEHLASVVTGSLSGEAAEELLGMAVNHWADATLDELAYLDQDEFESD